MYWPVAIVVLAPLAGALLNGLLGKRLGVRFAATVGVGSVALAFLAALGPFGAALFAPPEGYGVLRLWHWVPLGNLHVAVAFRVDALSAVMMLIVSSVALLVHIYSVEYMAGDRDYPRYFACLNLLVGSMLILVLAENLLFMFVGWEGVGLCSYLLIGHWFERERAARAAQKAFIVNCLGDCGLLIGILVLSTTCGTLGIKGLEGALGRLTPAAALASALLLFMAATAKSAQLPLHVWLPDAAEAPMPAGALIHTAATAAGVYLVVRLYFLYAVVPLALTLIAVVGALTAVFGAVVAVTQFDIRRVLAYSTISQFGYMFLACGVGAHTAGIFHLVTHAFCKALLFLAAGSVMHALQGETDLRRMGGLRHALPGTHAAFLLGCLALAGLPPLSGFFSGNQIMLNVFGSHHVPLWGLGLFGSFLTAFYLFRLYYGMFHGGYRGEAAQFPREPEAPRLMLGPLYALAAAAAVAGLLGPPLGRHLIGDFLHRVVREPQVHLAPAAELGLMIAAAAVALLGLLAAWRLYLVLRRPPDALQRWSPACHDFLFSGCRVDALYEVAVVKPGLALCRYLANAVDNEALNGAVNGLAAAFRQSGELLRRIQVGSAAAYLLYFAVGALILIAVLLRG